MALFNNIKYEIIWNMWTGDGIWQKKSTTGQSWICILHDKNTDEYFLHGYQLYYGEDKKNPTLRIMRDFVKPINCRWKLYNRPFPASKLSARCQSRQSMAM